jgi:acyl-coenzyme A synthetase/AMP-(fatty) acid ligase
MATNDLPVMGQRETDDVVAWRPGRAVTYAAFLADVNRLVQQLPERSYVINLCEDRYRFMVGFVAALQRGQVNLAPPSRATSVLRALRQQYPSSYVLVDSGSAAMVAESVSISVNADGTSASFQSLNPIPADQTAALVFTSGSTGYATSHTKTWGSLVRGAELVTRRLGVSRSTRASLLATVPPQHMYGLEFSIVLPLQSGIATSSACPLFPDDVRAALSALPAPRVLVSTPVHLRSCMEAGLRWPAVDLTLSAAAPLSPELARTAEESLATTLIEIYGSTETGAIASRRTAQAAPWHLLDDLELSPASAGVTVFGGQLDAPMTLADRLEIRDDRHFDVVGRDQDMVKIGGKRASLANINRVLLEIPGVVDGAVIWPETRESLVTRLAALVVAPSLEEEEILRALGERLDQAFLPRPLCKVESLPRSPLGKLRREDAIALLRAHRGGA